MKKKLPTIKDITERLELLEEANRRNLRRINMLELSLGATATLQTPIIINIPAPSETIREVPIIGSIMEGDARIKGIGL